jgi:hypothetical protein
VDPTVGAGLIGAGAAIVGGGVAGAVSFVVERERSQAAGVETRRAALRSACSDFTAAIARVRHQSYSLPADLDAQRLLVQAFEEARIGCERLRILIISRTTQRAARLALRHAYAVWKLAETGVDPRAAIYPDETPHQRLRKELTVLYVGVRQELGVPNPEEGVCCSFS